MKLNEIIYRCLSVIVLIFALNVTKPINAQINTDQVMNIGRNAMYFEDYVLSIQYFNQVISMKPYLADPYYYRAVAKYSLGDYRGAEEDCTLAIERNPFIIDAYQVRGVARQNMHKYKDAIDDYDKGLKYLPEHKYFLINKAVCEVSVKQYESAIKTYDKLIRLYPKFENAYIGRAELYMAQKDTIKALENINKSIELNKNEPNAYVMRSEIKMRSFNDVKGALADMDEAIKLEPHYSGFFINRAFMKYKLDDYFGSMSDYDYALSLDPTNVTAYYNRGLLKMEVNENNKAIEDFTYVLKSDPGHVMARYNRASLYYKTGQYKKAVYDYDELLKIYPNFQMALYSRSECKRLSGDMAGAERDYNRSRELYKKNKSSGDPDMFAENKNEVSDEHTSDGTEFESEDAVKNKFNTLLTVENDNVVKPEYDNKTRGRVQNRNMKIDNEPMFVLSFYTGGSDVKESSYYMKEVDEANSSKLLQFVLQLTNRMPRLYEDQIQKHFNSIEYYNGMLVTSKPRAIDYLGRALDFMMVKNPDSAIEDCNRAIAMRENFTLAYFVRASARYLQIELGEMSASETMESQTNKINAEQEAMLKQRKNAKAYAEVINDFDKVLEYSPKNVYAQYNKGCVYAKNNNLTSAISCFTLAIKEKADFGEAYYNRGLMYLQLGNKEKGISDLSKAGELGILPSYSVLKRMN